MSLYALIDCNNFFVSCERAFNPQLKNVPVAVLSSNDGCVVARSNEVKALNIPMGIAVFEVEHILRKNKVILLSSNYSLYADMSRRIMETIRTFTPEVEVYSVDEAFIRIDHTSYPDPTALGQLMRSTIKQWTGIPVSIGIAPTKTLAKVANEVAKKSPSYPFVLNLNNQPHLTDEILSTLPVREIWGVGRQYTKSLNRFGIHTALDIKTATHDFIKKNFGVNGLRLKYELSGTSCMSLNVTLKNPKSIMHSQTFGHAVESKQLLAEATSSFTTKLAAQLRSKQCVARTIHVRIESSRHKADSYTWRQAHITLPEPTDDTMIFLRAVRQLIDRIYEPHISYKRAAVTLVDITANTAWQHTLLTHAPSVLSDKTKPGLGTSWVSFGKYLDDAKEKNRTHAHDSLPQQTQTLYPIFHENKKTRIKTKTLYQAIDTLNTTMGKNVVQFGSSGLQQKQWSSKSEMRSPRYTTRWDELLVVT